MRTTQVLLVDDDDVDVMAVQRAFRAAKLEATLLVAHDGIMALEMLRGQRAPFVSKPYVILLDLNMPRMSGVEFLRTLRADPEHGHAIVFVLTTSASEEDKAAAYAEFASGYIVKSTAGHDFMPVINLLEAYWAAVELP